MTVDRAHPADSAGRSGPAGSTSWNLLASARSADPAAWERLVRDYAPLVATWCRRWGVAEQDIPDILQEVFTAVATHLDRFRKETHSDTFRGWLLTIARNKVRDHGRRQVRQPNAAGGTEAGERLNQIPNAEVLRAIDESVNQRPLPENLQEALKSIRGEFQDRTWLAFWGMVVEGRAARDVGIDLEMTPGAVRVAKSRVLLRLREVLGQQFPPAPGLE